MSADFDFDFSDTYNSIATQNNISMGWRDLHGQYVDNRLAIIQPIIADFDKDVKVYLAGGCVRDLVYPIRYPRNAPVKDIDIFVTGLHGDRKDIFKMFEDMKAKLGTMADWGDYSDDGKPNLEEKNRFFVLDVKGENDHPDIQIVEGRKDIMETVGHFDWYECAWWLDYPSERIAKRVNHSYAKNLAAPNMRVPEERTLTLMHCHHPSKTLVRGFRFAQRHGFRILVEDVQALSTEIRLQADRYGQYLYT